MRFCEICSGIDVRKLLLQSLLAKDYLPDDRMPGQSDDSDSDNSDSHYQYSNIQDPENEIAGFHPYLRNCFKHHGDDSTRATELAVV